MSVSIYVKGEGGREGGREGGVYREGGVVTHGLGREGEREGRRERRTAERAAKSCPCEFCAMEREKRERRWG